MAKKNQESPKTQFHAQATEQAESQAATNQEATLEIDPAVEPEFQEAARAHEHVEIDPESDVKRHKLTGRPLEPHERLPKTDHELPSENTSKVLESISEEEYAAREAQRTQGQAQAPTEEI